MKALLFFVFILLILVFAGCSGGSQPPVPSALHVITTEVPVAQPGQLYTTQIRAAGGNAPYHWRVIGGSLPDGITLSDSGILFGQSSEIGKFDFTAQVTDSSTAAQSAEMKVEEATNRGSK